MGKNALMGFVFGVALAVYGMPYTSPKFWLLMPLAALWATVIAPLGRNYSPGDRDGSR